MNRCKDCNTTEGVNYVDCPYDRIILNENNKVLLCTCCYNKRELDINPKIAYKKCRNCGSKSDRVGFMGSSAYCTLNGIACNLEDSCDKWSAEPEDKVILLQRSLNEIFQICEDAEQNGIQCKEITHWLSNNGHLKTK